jgi:DNA polymerase-3 subunit beta
MSVAEKAKAKTTFHVTLDRDPLLGVVGRVRSVVEKRGTIPILRNLKLVAADGRLAITGTDLDMEMSDSIECAGSGEVTVDAELIAGLLQKMPAGAECDLNLGEGDPRLILKCGRSRYQLPILPASDFPSINAGELGPPFSLDTNDFAGLIDKTAFAMSTEETRYYLNGLYLHPVDALMRTVSTDSRRLALAEMPGPMGYGEAKGIIIPRKTIREITKLLEGAGETFIMRLSERQIRIETGTAVLISKVIDGSFPPYERVIPKDNPRTVTLDRQILCAAIERAMVMSVERSVPLKLDIEAGALRLSIRNTDTGQGDEEMEAEYDGPAISVGFNGRYLLDAMGRIDDPKVEFRFSDSAGGSGPSLDPALIIDPSNASVRFVLMPLRA